jgi:transposase-like protein
MDDLKNFCCQNKHCPEYGIRGKENIRFKETYGKNDTRLLQCKVCKKRFSENRGTIFFDSRLPKEKVVSIMEHVAEGNGMRKTARLTNVGHMTVSRYTHLAGKHAEELHDELVAFSPSNGRGSIRRKVGLRVQKGTTLRCKQSG